MKIKFPLSDATLRQVRHCRQVEAPVATGDNWQANQDEFAIQVEGVGEFYVFRGNQLEFAPVWDADPQRINIHLNGQVLAALMHQRKIINFHASSFIHQQKGILLLGETGAGKSSLTAAFTLDGAGFLSDDFTPVIFDNGLPLIWPVYKRIKLRENTVWQLDIHPKLIKNRESVSGKYFLDVEKAKVGSHTLNVIVKIETGNCQITEFSIPDPMEKFSILRSEICSWEILSGMKETEEAYLQQLLDIVSHTEMVKIIRPEIIEIRELKRQMELYLEGVGPPTI